MKNEIVECSKDFAVRIIRLSKFMDEKKMFTLSRQIIRSGTSIGANVHEAQSAETKKDFAHKMNIALKEAREVEYWLDIVCKAEIIPEIRLADLRIELDEITRMLVSIIKTTRKSL